MERRLLLSRDSFWSPPGSSGALGAETPFGAPFLALLERRLLIRAPLALVGATWDLSLRGTPVRAKVAPTGFHWSWYYCNITRQGIESSLINTFVFIQILRSLPTCLNLKECPGKLLTKMGSGNPVIRQHNLFCWPRCDLSPLKLMTLIWV